MINLIPYPKKLTEKGGVCLIPDRIGYTLRGFQPDVLEVFQQRVPNAFSEGRFLSISLSNYYGAEAYNLAIRPKQIDIVAGGIQGAKHALTTLFVLIDGNAAPCCIIDDEPSLKHRGLSLDCARHFYKVPEIKKILEEMSLLKMNVLHWHLSDDQGFRIESFKFPELQEKSEQYYTQVQIKEIVQYATSRGIEIIPEIDLPGHTSAILAAYPEYSCSGKAIRLKNCGGIFTTTLCPTKESTKQFIFDLLAEIIPLFPSKRFHIGGDEAPSKEWQECPDCKARVEALGLSSFKTLQSKFEEEIIAFLTEQGKQAICWSDVLDGTNSPKAQIQYWHVNHTTNTFKFIKNGGEVIYSDMFDYYLDYPESMTNLKRLYSANAHLDFVDVSKKIYGMEACMWTEHVEDSQLLEQRIFPRLMAFSERAWGTKRSYKEFEERLNAYLEKPFHNLSYLPKEEWNIKGDARQVQTINYFKNLMDIYHDDSGNTEKTPISFRFGFNFATKFIRINDIESLMELYKPQNKE